MSPFIWIIVVFSFLFGFIKGIYAPRSSRKWRDYRGKRVLVHDKYVKCSTRDEAYKLAKEKGKGTEPIRHAPHQQDSDFYWHYHIGNHELVYEDDEWVNYHFYYGQDIDGCW